MFAEVLPLWFCAEYAKTGSVSYWESLRAVKEIAVALWLRLTGSDPVWLEALNVVTVAGLFFAGDTLAVKSVPLFLFGIQMTSVVKRKSDFGCAALRSAVLAATGIYMVVVSRLWALECAAEQGVPLLASGILSLTASRSVWRINGQT